MSKFPFVVRVVLFFLSVIAAVGLRGAYDASFYFLYVGFLVLLFRAEWFEAVGYSLMTLWFFRWRAGFPPELLAVTLAALGVYAVRYFLKLNDERHAVWYAAFASMVLYISIAGGFAFEFIGIALRDVIVGTLWAWGIARLAFSRRSHSILQT